MFSGLLKIIKIIAIIKYKILKNVKTLLAIIANIDFPLLLEAILANPCSFRFATISSFRPSLIFVS